MPRTYRVLSVIAALALSLSLVALLAVRQAQSFQARGTPLSESPSGFPAPVSGAESLLLGVNASLETYAPATLDAMLRELAARGVGHVRQEFRWADIEPQRGQFDWATSDAIFGAAKRHGLRLLPVLWTTPAWARAPSGSARFPATDTAPPRDPADFARFARAFAERYDRATSSAQPSPILAYQIWDEPNLSAAWGNGLINPAEYLRLLKDSGDAIRGVNARARIALAGLAPTVVQSDVNLAPQSFLRRLYELGGKDAFDVAAAKPYGFNFPPDDRRVDAGVLNFSHVVLLREEMLRHGDGDKAIWLTQFGWNALPRDWRGEASVWGDVSEAQQADFTRRAVARAAAEWPWVGAMFLYTAQPNALAASAQWGFAAFDQQARPRAVLDAFAESIAAAQQSAPRAQRFAACDAPTTAAADCFRPNPLAQFSPGWRFGELGADAPDTSASDIAPSARFTFSGDALALIVRRGDYRAYTFVDVDGRPANLLPREPGPDGRGAYLIMTSPDLAPRVETIEVANHLGPGSHVAEVRVDRGWNQWALVGWSSRAASDDSRAVSLGLMGLAALSLAVLVVSSRRARWGEAMRAVRGRWRAPTALAMATALALWLASAMTWAQDAATAYRNLGLPANVVVGAMASGVLFFSPVLVLSVVALVALFVLIVLRLEVGLMLLAFFIPFYLIPQRLFARAFSMAELLTLMCLASWAARKIWAAARRRTRAHAPGRAALKRVTLLDWSVLALVLVAFASALQAEFKVEAFRELRVVIAESAAVYLMLRTTRMATRDRNGIVAGFLAGATAVSLIGLLNYARGDVFASEGGLPRIKSVWGSPNNDALFLGRAWPLLAALAAGYWLVAGSRATRPTANVWLLRALATFAFVVVSLALLLTQSRGAMLLGLPAALIAMGFVAGGKWRVGAVVVLALVVAALGLLLSGAATPLLQGTRFAQALDLNRGTGFFRLNLWQSAWQMFIEHPLLGVGPDNFLYAYRSHYIAPAAWQEPNLSHAHNLLFDPLARLGALGALAWLGALVGLALQLRVGLRRARDLTSRLLLIGFVGALADLIAHGLVDNTYFVLDLAFAFMLACGIVARTASDDANIAPLQQAEA